MLYGMEDYGLDHLTVVDGDLADVYDPAKKAVAVVVPTDDYGKGAPGHDQPQGG